mmetsp:Transcript_22648/g.37145  ORF Transcript_22648/g.37145 Transcript_22648/m.37145 type:complete len:141 (+) Transcript_22648:2500-2922(+)
MLETLLHANTVAVDGKAVLIQGASGTGKSSLSLQLMALGGQLVADDQTHLRRLGSQIWASAPTSVAGLIEARGVGILTAPYVAAPITLVVDLDKVEKERLPQRHVTTLLGQTRDCLHKVENPAWPAAILQYLKGSRRDPS